MHRFNHLSFVPLEIKEVKVLAHCAKESVVSWDIIFVCACVTLATDHVKSYRLYGGCVYFALGVGVV